MSYQNFPLPVPPGPLPFDLKVKFIKHIISTKEGWEKLATSVKNTGLPGRLNCISVLKHIATESGTTKEEAHQIFTDFVKTLDQYLSQP